MHCIICTCQLLDDIVDCPQCHKQFHRDCLQQWTDYNQAYRVQSGHPLRSSGECPLCRAELPTILPKPVSWAGTVEITTPVMEQLLRQVNINSGFITMDNVPEEISIQMPNAHPKEQQLFANTAATMLWVCKHDPLPQKLRLTQYTGGAFRHHIIY